MVHLEEYPLEHLPKQSDRPPPLRAMRVLKIVDPSRHALAGDHELKAVPGELLMKGRRPWGFSPSDPNSNIRKAVAHWLCAQSSSGKPSQLP